MPIRTAIILILILIGLTISGSFGFRYIEGWSWFDSIYMAVITLSTVGYEEVHPLSDAGRIFVMIFVVIGLGFFLYSTVQIAEIAMKAELHHWYGRRKMDSKLNKIQQHFIVCGYGRMGKTVCAELHRLGHAFVIIDSSDEALRECGVYQCPTVRGDATDDDILKMAGIERARGIATVLDSDADNLYVIMSARLLNKELQIIGRAADEKTVVKMRNAGANRVVSVYGAAGSKMAHLLANPRMEDFFEVVSPNGTRDVDLAEIEVSTTSEYIGKHIEETDFRTRGVMIVGIRRKDGQLILPLGNQDVIHAGDNLIAISKVGIVSTL